MWVWRTYMHRQEYVSAEILQRVACSRLIFIFSYVLQLLNLHILSFSLFTREERLWPGVQTRWCSSFLTHVAAPAYSLTPVHLSGLSSWTAVRPPVWMSMCACVCDYESTRWLSVPLHWRIWVKVSTWTAHACTDRSLLFPAHCWAQLKTPGG